MAGKRAPLTEEQKQALRDRLAKGREAKAAKQAARAEIPETVPPLRVALPEDAEPEEAAVIERLNTQMAAAWSPDERRALDDGLFTEDELREIREQAAKQVREDLKKRRRQELMASAKAGEMRRRAGIPDDEKEMERLAELCHFQVMLPEGGGPGLRIDGTLYVEGRTFAVTRAQFETMNEMQTRAWMHHFEVEGKSRRHAAQLAGFKPQGSPAAQPGAYEGLV